MDGVCQVDPASDQWIVILPRHASTLYGVLNNAMHEEALRLALRDGYTNGMSCVAGFRIDLGAPAIQHLLAINNIPFHSIGRIPGDAFIFDCNTIHWVVNHDTCVKVSIVLYCGFDIVIVANGTLSFHRWRVTSVLQRHAPM
jgi:hypothetical protein